MRALNLSGSRRIWLSVFLLPFVILAALLLLPSRPVELTSSTAPWTSKGCFRPNSVYPSVQFEKSILLRDRANVSLWGSWCGSDASTGELFSPAFNAPVILDLFVSGQPRENGPQLFLEPQDDHSRIPLPITRQPGENWVRVQWWLDSNARGRSVRLVAVDNDTAWAGWIGVSAPRRLSLLGLCRQQLHPALLILGVYLAQLLFFLLPGFALASWVASKRPVTALSLVILLVATGSALGYVSFWAFFFSKGLGQLFTLLVYLASVGLLLPPLGKKSAIKTTAQLVFEPLLYTASAGLCYMCFYFLFTPQPFGPEVAYAGERFFHEVRPGDNIIPQIFAHKIYERAPIRPFCCGEWLSSDRPPLQAGVVLLERPLPLHIADDFNYELLATALQSLWIFGLWCLLESLAVPRRRIRQILGFLVFCGFLFYNSVYTWPKLYASAYILFLLAICFDLIRTRRVLNYFEASVAALSLGLALMAHPGSVFSLPVFALVFVYYRRLFPLPKLGLALLIILAFSLPWSAYQKYVDPPGNRLLKMHLGGVIPVDSRSTWQAIRERYHEFTWQQIARYRWTNLQLVIGDRFFESYGLANTAGTEDSRIAQREFIWNAIGLANLGWIAGLLLFFKRPKQGLAIPAAGWLIAAAVANLVFWCLILFGPKNTYTTEASYADLFLLSVGLLGLVLTLPRPVYLVLLGWQLLNFFTVWIWYAPARLPEPALVQLPLLAVGLVLTLALISFSVGPTFRTSAKSAPGGQRSYQSRYLGYKTKR